MTFKIERILWLEEILEKLWWKHHVEEHEVIELFANRPKLRFVEKGFRPGEDVYSAGGRTNAGRLLLVFYILKPSSEALILSAREMTPGERKRYDQK